MKKTQTKLLFLAVLSMMLLLVGCVSKITGVTLTLPETLERGQTGTAVPEYLYSGSAPDQEKADQLIQELGMTYSSSDESILTVEADGTITAVAPGAADITLTSQDGEITATGTVEVVVTPTGLTLPETLTLFMDSEPTPLEVTVTPEDATGVVMEYTSSDESIIAVGDQGNISPIALGEADVTAAISGTELKAVCHIVVQPAIEALKMSNSSVTLKAGASKTLSLAVTPKEIDTSSAVWTSSDESIVTVDAQGTITAVAEGEATVTAVLNGMEATCSVTVSNKTSSSGSSGSGSNSSSSTSTAYGALPISEVAGTQKWFYIESSDSAYSATLQNINAYRAAAGVAPLSVDSGLSAIATQRCDAMVVAGVLSHDGYQTPEIIAQNYNSAQSVVDAWAASSGHYAAMINARYTKCGIGCYFCETGASYWCVTFG